MTEGSPQKGSLVRVYTDLPMPRDTQWSSQKWAKHVDRTFLSQSSFPGPFDHFVIAWGIRTTNLICQIIDIKGNCDPCCYYLLLLRPQVWKCLALLGAGSYKSTFGREGQSSSSRNVSQARGHSLGCLPQGPPT